MSRRVDREHVVPLPAWLSVASAKHDEAFLWCALGVAALVVRPSCSRVWLQPGRSEIARDICRDVRSYFCNGPQWPGCSPAVRRSPVSHFKMRTRAEICFGVTKSSHSRMRTRASCTRAPCTHAFAAHEGGAHRGRHCVACAPPRPRSLPCALRTSTRVHRALGTRAARVRAPRRRRPCSHTATHACTSKAGCDA